MIDSLPRKKTPKWLADVDAENQSSPFSLHKILRSSLYYPSSGLDGDPIKYLSGNFYSFVYVDYGISSDELEARLKNPGFNGYHRILSRKITQKKLSPDSWPPLPPSRQDGDHGPYSEDMEKPFVTWSVFQRDDSLSDEHGAERFSLLFLCADGVKAFRALYLSRQCFPLGIAIIQPGHGMGGNWTDFTDPAGPLATSILNNPAGKPRVLLDGGLYDDDLHREACWPQYSNNVCFLEKEDSGSIGVWLASA
jgi:hypothetical protein